MAKTHTHFPTFIFTRTGCIHLMHLAALAAVPVVGLAAAEAVILGAANLVRPDSAAVVAIVLERLDICIAGIVLGKAVASSLAGVGAAILVFCASLAGPLASLHSS